MTAEQMDERTRALLIAARDLAEEIAIREERLKELRTKSISSPSMDGMPRGSGGDANAARLIMIEKREHEIERDRKRLERIRSAARRAIKPFKVQQRIFYQAYYIDGLKASTARAEAQISERTMMRYLSAIRIKKETGE